MRTISLILRRLTKNKSANILGISGLVVGLVCVMFIFLWVTNEVQYDRYHKNLDRIFTVHAYLEGGTEKIDFPGCPPAVGPSLKNEYPEVVQTCRYIPPYFQYLFRSGDRKFIERTAMAEFELFDIFSLPFLYGGKGEKGDPNQVILTERTARKYFGKQNPVGEILSLDNRLNVTVVGVLKEIPKNSTFNFDAIIPIDNIGFYYTRDNYLTSWYNNSFVTFGLLNNETGFEKIAANVTNRIQKELPNSTNFLRAYKFADGYLYEQNNIRKVKIFVLIAFLVLLSATLNFINLSTARSTKQAKETGLRKTIGASRKSIVSLIYTDVAFVTFIALSISLILVFAGLNIFNHTIGKEISFSSLFSPIPLLALSGIFVFTVLLSGSYPAFFLSSFSPIKTLSSNYRSAHKRGLLRNSMVVVIFIVSIVLMSSTLIISKQTNHLQNMDLGFEREQLMYIPLNGKLKEKAATLKQEIKRSPDVLETSFVSDLPILIGNNSEDWSWAGMDPEFKLLVTNWRVDHNMLETFGASMAEGSMFRQNQSGILINKTFADQIGWDSFEGKTIRRNNNEYIIRGVVNDIHFNSLSEETKPMVIYQQTADSRSNRYLILKVNTEKVENLLAHVKNTCQKLDPAYPPEYEFLDARYHQLLESEVNTRKLVSIFSAFALVVLILGIFGLVLFLAEQKIKEIGIRKCLGESVFSICARFIKPFVVSGIIASVIGIPLTWYAMDQWLQNYANRIQLNIWVFVLAGIFTIAIAIATVLWQSWKTSTRNPVEALRYE